MDSGPAENQCMTNRRLGRRFVMLALLVISAAGVFSPTESHASTRRDVAFAPPAADTPLLREPSSGDTGVCADGAIDAFEDDHLCCDLPNPACLQRIELLATCLPRVARFASIDLARSHLARGPPSA
jgi:hypothetical protein